MGALAMLADVSERERLQAQLRDAQRMESIGFLAGGIAHDFNNIMTAVGGYAAMAKESVGAEHPAAGDLVEVERATTRAKALTDQLLTFSRRQIVQPRVVDLALAVSDAQPALRQLLDPAIDLLVDAEPGSAWVRVDPGQIQQVIANLAANADDAMPDGGSLRLTVESDPPGPLAVVRLIVSDTGKGLEPDVASHAFEPFYTTKATGEGPGLGLAVVHGIVRGSGGQIQLRSRPGAGATFTVTLPLVEPEIPPRAAPDADGPSEAPATGPAPAPATILVVEDEASLRSLARRILELAGHRVVEAGDGVEALEVAADLPTIDLLLTDLTMPRMDGATLADTLTGLRPGLPVLYMSGYGEGRLGKDGLLDPTITLLTKPFSVDDLTDAVASMLKAGVRT
jgi:CheY-like chemotaxis protein